VIKITTGRNRIRSVFLLVVVVGELLRRYLYRYDSVPAPPVLITTVVGEEVSSVVVPVLITTVVGEEVSSVVVPVLITTVVGEEVSGEATGVGVGADQLLLPLLLRCLRLPM